LFYFTGWTVKGWYEMKILLATDGSSCSELAVDEVARRPWPEDSQIRIISVVEPHAQLTAEPYIPIPQQAEADKAARRYAEAAVERASRSLSEAGHQLQVSTDILNGSPKRVLVEETEKWGADLIVVGSHGYRSWERMLLGSVSQAVAMHAECSVEIVRRKR
jgi:nucleotide-binding universal stress UspA family protein